MRFAVPQFIDVEDRIFGDLTLKQAIYLAGGVAVVATLFLRAGILLTVVLGIPVALLSFALAFLKINNRPFYLVVYAGVFYMFRNKLYLWKRVEKKTKTGQQQTTAQKGVAPVTPKLSQSRLKELAWSLDTRESMYTKEDQWK